MKPNIETCIQAIATLANTVNDVVSKVDDLAENQAKINTQANQRTRQYTDDRIFETPDGRWWGTIIATQDFKKGSEISVNLEDAPNSKPKPNFPEGKKAYKVSLKKHVRKEDSSPNAVTSDSEDPSSTPEESRTQKQAPVTTEKGEKVAA